MTIHGLPPEAIEIDKRDEVSYSFLTAKKRAALPTEGKWVWEMVTEEMLGQFGIPVNQEILITTQEGIRQELSKFVDNFYLVFTDPKR